MRAFSTSNTVILRYYSRNRLSSITDAKGGKTTYHYTGERLTKIVSPDGTELKLTYENGNIASAEAENSISYLTYARERLTEIRQCNKFASVAHGAVSGNVTEVSSTLMEYSVDWSDGLGLDSTSLTDETGKTETYRFRSLGKPYDYRMLESGKVVQAERYAEYYVDGTGAETTPPDGVKCNRRKVTQAHENCLHVSASAFAFAEGDYEITALDSDNMPIWKETNQQIVSSACTKKYRTDYAYDDEKHLIRESLTTATKIGNTETTATEVIIYTYDENGRCIRKESYVEGEEATTGINVEETVYGKKGEVLTVRKYNTLDSASVLCEEKEYAEDGTVCAEKDATGEHATTYTYAPDSGKLRASHYPSGATLAYGYEKDGSMSAITQSTEEGEENTTRLARTAGLVTELTSGNTTVRYEYDGKGRKNKVNVNGAEISYSYADHVTQNEKIVNKVSELRPSANSETVSDPHGNVLKTSVNGSTQFTASYNEKDLPTAVQDAAGNQSITYSYDAYDHLTRYEAVPNSASYTNAHAVTEEYAYTSEGLLAHKALSVDCNETVTEAYAYKDNAAKELDFITVGGTVRVVPAKDALGRSTGKAISFNGTKIAEEQITYLKVGDHATPLPATVRFGSPSSVSSNGYSDTRFGLTDCLKYKYDAMGNVTEVKENGRITARYFYDAIGRLVREDNRPMGKTAAFTYDNNGNITAKRIYAFTLCSAEELEERECEEIAYTYSGDRLLSYGNECCIYDENGNPTVYRDQYVAWEYGKRLSTYGATSYTYNGLGQLALLNGEPFTYDSTGRLIQRGDTLRFLYAGNERIGLRYGGADYFYRKDALGNIISLLDNSGAVVVKYVYDAWGNHKVLNPNGTENTAYDFIGNVNPFRYRGYYFDTTTGLYYLHSRFYDPVTGRFLSPDSVEYLDPETINGLNLYAYCGNNPVMNIDPVGRAFCSTLIISIIFGAVIGSAISGVTAYNEGAWGIDLLGSILSGAIMGAAMGAILTIGGAAGLASLGINIAGYTLTSFWTALGISSAIGVGAGVASYGVGNGLREDKTLSVEGFVYAGLLGGLKGATTFVIGFFGGKFGAFDKMFLKPLLKGADILTYKLAKGIMAAAFPSIGRTILTTSSFYISEFLTKLLFVSSTAAIARWIIDQIFDS